MELPTAVERAAWSAAGRTVNWTPAPAGAEASLPELPPLRFRVVVPARDARRADVDHDLIAATLLEALTRPPA